jgi:hypothetical protein
VFNVHEFICDIGKPHPFQQEKIVIEGRLASGYAPNRICKQVQDLLFVSQLTDARELMLPSNVHNASALLLPTLQLTKLISLVTQGCLYSHLPHHDVDKIGKVASENRQKFLSIGKIASEIDEFGTHILWSEY